MIHNINKKSNGLHFHTVRVIELLKKKYIKEEQRNIIKKLVSTERKQKVKYYLKRAGIDLVPNALSKIIFNTVIVINLLISTYLLYYFSTIFGTELSTIFLIMFLLWVFFFYILIFVIWAIFYLIVDLKIYKRRIDVEDVLPDFLLLTASNISAGMPIDRALWFAIRPRFGVLSKEIELVAKETIGGKDIKEALVDFAGRYDSVILKRTISMINEGIESGGKIGEMLNKIAYDVQNQKSMMSEMSANVTTYIIFITFASVTAAPVLFALSAVLIEVVDKISFGLGSSIKAISSNLPLSFSGVGVSKTDFKIFSIVTLTMTSMFSAMLISTIKKGNISSGIKLIPIFIVTSLIIYFIANLLASKLLGLFF